MGLLSKLNLYFEYSLKVFRFTFFTVFTAICMQLSTTNSFPDALPCCFPFHSLFPTPPLPYTYVILCICTPTVRVILLGWATASATNSRFLHLYLLTGAHLNPAITIMQATMGRFPWWKVPLYLLAQLLGGFVSGAVVFSVYYGKCQFSHVC